MEKRQQTVALLYFFLGLLCEIAIFMVCPFNTPVSAEEPEEPLDYDPVIVDTINVFDIYQPPVIAEIPTEQPRADPPPVLSLSDEDLDLIALIVHAEAGNQSRDGKRLVADVILNRLDSPRFPNDIPSVVSQTGQFATYRVRNRYVADNSDYDAVLSELYRRLDPTVLYFASGHYIGTTPLYKVGDHYFSK